MLEHNPDVTSRTTQSPGEIAVWENEPCAVVTMVLVAVGWHVPSVVGDEQVDEVPQSYTVQVGIVEHAPKVATHVRF